MSSSSDIEKLFDHFGGDANAYQEIGRENEARSARTRWPLLVTLDLTQPMIPAIGQHRDARPRSPDSEPPVAVDRQDTTPKDAASVTRAKAPLFTRSHRRDIPPVAVAVTPTMPRGASRFGELAVPANTAPPAPALQQTAQATPPASTVPVPASVPPLTASRPSVAQTFSSSGPGWALAPAPARADSTTPAASTEPAQSASILGKLFAPESAHASAPQHAATASESAPLQSVFDRLRGVPAQAHAMPSAAAAPAGAPRAAAPAAANGWLVNGPRRL